MIARYWLAGLFCTFGLAACVTPAASIRSENRPRIVAERIAQHVQILASESFGGRAPGTEGEDKTVEYIAKQFAAAGLVPGYRGNWFQEVPLVRAQPLTARFAMKVGAAQPALLKQGDEVMLVSGRWEPDVTLEQSQVLFVGYGINAPDLKHDDYAGVDVRGRTVLMLAWAPDTPAFLGAARFRYGVPTVKSVEAAKRGAAAVLIVVPDGEAWDQSLAAVRNRMLNAGNATPPKGPGIDGRIKRSVAERLLASAGQRLSELEQRAAMPDFRPVTLKMQASGSLKSEVRRFNSRNVVGILLGEERPNEHVLFVGHWDAYGSCGPDEGGDGVCNGALDNASGIGELIELARLFGSQGTMARSILFIAATAEEQGLLGSTHYTRDPALPLAQAVAGATLDITAGRERGTDLVLFGKGLSELDPYFERAAALQGRKVVAPRADDANYFERSDNIAFVRLGVPVLTPSGVWSEGPGREDSDAYFERHYHRPSDEFATIRSFEGAAEDGELLYHFGRALASSNDWPGWLEGSPYSALRQPRNSKKTGD